VLLLGGRDKNLPLEGLAHEALARCRAVILFGESAPKLDEALRAAPARDRPPVLRVPDLPHAVQAARGQARPGDVVLLSPACTSFDAYDNFERRGEHFAALVRGMIDPAAAGLEREVQPSLP
jgi:UDP-N-acetylmuramoylalanine--D-glutamate ligase